MIKAVIFDLDGTLYPEVDRNKLMFFEFLTNVKFFLAFKQIRKKYEFYKAINFRLQIGMNFFPFKLKCFPNI